jgi:hypothetical protein
MRKARQTAAKYCSSIFPTMPEAQNSDCCIGKLVSELIVANNQSAHIARRERRNALAKLRISQELFSCGYQLLHNLGGGARGKRIKKSMKSNQITVGARRPLKHHGVYTG